MLALVFVPSGCNYSCHSTKRSQVDPQEYIRASECLMVFSRYVRSRLNIHSKVTAGVNFSVSGYLSLYVTPVMDWRTVQAVTQPSPSDYWDSPQLSLSCWMNGWMNMYLFYSMQFLFTHFYLFSKENCWAANAAITNLFTPTKAKRISFQPHTQISPNFLIPAPWQQTSAISQTVYSGAGMC